MSCCVQGTETRKTLCSVCNEAGHPVSIRTVHHHVTFDQLHRILDQHYRFCDSPNCDVVYFGEKSGTFRTHEVREVVTIKNGSQNDFPVCYCFGFHSRHFVNTAAGTPGPAKIIRDLIAKGMCDCEIRNPSGNCCLGEVVKLEKRIR